MTGGGSGNSSVWLRSGSGGWGWGCVEGWGVVASGRAFDVWRGFVGVVGKLFWISFWGVLCVFGPLLVGFGGFGVFGVFWSESIEI